MAAAVLRHAEHRCSLLIETHDETPLVLSENARQSGVHRGLTVTKACYARFFRAVDAAEEPARRDLDTVADDPASAVAAGGREHVNRTLETVERMCRVAHRDGEALVVIVSAMIAAGHVWTPSRYFGLS